LGRYIIWKGGLGKLGIKKMSKNAPEKNTQASFCLPLQGPLQGHTTEVLEIVNCAGHEIVKMIEISNEKSECCGETAIFESDREREREIA